MRRLLFAVALLLPSSVIRPQSGAGSRDYDVGRAHMRANEPSRAERSFERAIEKEPRNGLYHLWLGNAVGLQAGSASVLRQPFMARRIKAEFERAVQLDPELLDAREGLITFYLVAPAVMGGDVGKAREQQREIARRDVVRGHIAAASLAWHGRDTVATERSLRAASTAAPDSLAAAAALASRLFSWKRNGEAFGVWDGYLVRQPQSITARYQFARLSAISGERLQDGERHLRAIVAIESWPENNWTPGKAAAYSRLGDILRHQRRREEARTAYERALALDADLQIAKDGLRSLGTTQ